MDNIEETQTNESIAPNVAQTEENRSSPASTSINRKRGRPKKVIDENLDKSDLSNISKESRKSLIKTKNANNRLTSVDSNDKNDSQNNENSPKIPKKRGRKKKSDESELLEKTLNEDNFLRETEPIKDKSANNKAPNESASDKKENQETIETEFQIGDKVW
jgi:hypothetical protein